MRNTVNILNRNSKLCRRSGHERENITEMNVWDFSSNRLENSPLGINWFEVKQIRVQW